MADELNKEQAEGAEAKSAPVETPPAEQQQAEKPAEQNAQEAQKVQESKDPQPAEKQEAQADDPWNLIKSDSERNAEAKEAETAEIAEYLAESGLGADTLEPIQLGRDAFGEDRVLSADDQRALLPYLREAGVPAKESPRLVKAIASIEAARIKTQVERDKAETAAIWNRTKETFGDEATLVNILKDAERGAVRIFPKDLWDEIKKVPALALDERFLRSLAAVGRSYRNDGGGPHTSSANAQPVTGGKLVFDLASFGKGTK